MIEEIVASQSPSLVPQASWAVAVARHARIRDLAAMPEVPAFVAAEAGRDLGVSARTVYRLLARYRSGGDRATDMLPARSNGGRGRGRLAQDVERITDDLITRRYIARQRITVRTLHREIAAECRRDGLAIPSASSVQRRVIKRRGAVMTRRRQGAVPCSDNPGTFSADSPWRNPDPDEVCISNVAHFRVVTRSTAYCQGVPAVPSCSTRLNTQGSSARSASRQSRSRASTSGERRSAISESRVAPLLSHRSKKSRRKWSAPISVILGVPGPTTGGFGCPAQLLSAPSLSFGALINPSGSRTSKLGSSRLFLPVSPSVSTPRAAHSDRTK